jgi:hypothetical protein
VVSRGALRLPAERCFFNAEFERPNVVAEAFIFLVCNAEDGATGDEGTFDSVGWRLENMFLKRPPDLEGLSLRPFV